MAGLLDLLLSSHLNGPRAGMLSGLPIGPEQAPGAVPGVDEADEAELARRRAALRLGGRRAPMPDAAEPAAAEPSQFNTGVPFAQVPPGFDAMDASANRRKLAGMPGTADWMMPPQETATDFGAAFAVPHIDAVAGMLSTGGNAGVPAADLPPSTNDPTSREPEVAQDGVPLPRPKPKIPGDQVAAPEVPLSLAPAAAGAMAAAGPAEGGGAPGGGMGGVLSKILNPANAPLLLALGAGLSGAPSFGTGMRRAAANATPVSLLMRKEQQTQLNQRDTYQALVQRGVPPQEAMAAIRSPEIMKAVVAKHFDTKPPMTVNGRLVRPDGTLIADFSDDKTEPKLSAGYQWVDPRDKSKGQVFIKGGEADPAVKAQSAKLSNPPTYEWVDPDDHSKGQRPIKGGAASKLSTDIAGKLAMMQEVQKDIPEARRVLMAGRGKTGTGASGAAASYTNIGDTGRAQRTVRTAIEAALRVMTGAAAPEQEVARYLGMFMPSPFDSVETATQKLNNLEGFIKRADELVGQGRTTGEAPPASKVVSGKTKSGITFSVEP